MTPKEINDLKKEHNEIFEQGQELFEQILPIHKKILELRTQIEQAEGDEYDPIPLIFGGGFWIDPDL